MPKDTIIGRICKTNISKQISKVNKPKTKEKRSECTDITPVLFK